MADSRPNLIEIPDRDLAGPLAPFPVGDTVDIYWASGYERTEATERLVRQRTAGEFPDHIRLWTRSMTFTFRLFDFLSGVPLEARSPLSVTARQLRFRLFTMAVGSMKVGLDVALGGYYAQAWGQIRFLAECMLQMMHARFRQNSATRWFGKITPAPGERQKFELTCENAIEAVEANAASYFGDEDERIWVAAKRLYKLGHKGAHPTSLFLWQTVGDEEWSYVFGANYNARAAQATLFWGIEAMFLLLGEMLITEKGDEAILIEHLGIMREHSRLYGEFHAQATEDVEPIEESDVPTPK